MIFKKLPVEIYLIIFDYLELSDFINFSLSLKLREYDDKAKVKGKQINNLKHYEDMLNELFKS